MASKILCLDIDGTVRRSKSGKTFHTGADDLELMPDIEEAVQEYIDDGWLVFGISNQGGVAHGFKTSAQVYEEMLATQKLFKKNPFKMIYCCCHDEKGSVEPYNHRSLLRKPNIGMLVNVESYVKTTYNTFADWNNSLFVGDRNEDEECAKNAGIPFMHIDLFLNKYRGINAGSGNG